MAPRSEDAGLEADETAQERGSADVTAPRLAPGFVYATNPDTGVEVVFVRGEALPDWAVPAKTPTAAKKPTAKRPMTADRKPTAKKAAAKTAAAKTAAPAKSTGAS